MSEKDVIASLPLKIFLDWMNSQENNLKIDDGKRKTY